VGQFINKSVTIMLPIGKEAQGSFRVLHPRALLIDGEGQLWRAIEHDIMGHYDLYAQQIYVKESNYVD
jgi:hypothetical protein